MRLRTKLFLAWGSLMFLLWAATLWPVQHTIASNFDRVADEGFAGTRRSLDAVQAERLKQMRQACWLVMNIPELRALIAEQSSELSATNLESLTERLDALSEMIGVNLVGVLDNRGTLIAQNHGSPWSTVEDLSRYLSVSPQASALVRQVFQPGNAIAKLDDAHSTQGMWVDHRQLYQIVGVPLIFGDGSDNSPTTVDGALIMASIVTDAMTVELGKGHNCQITFLADGSTVASNLTLPLRGELEGQYQPLTWKEGQAFEMTLGKTAYRSWLEPVNDPCSSQPVGAMLVQISLADLKSAQSRLSRVMLAILGSGLLAVALASFLLSGAVTRPVADLVEGVRKVADGDLDLAMCANRRDEIGELGGAFNDMVSQLRSRRELQRQVEESQAASRAKSQFLANMSHEIRTPLNGVVGMTQLLLTTPLNQRQRRYTDLVKSSAEVLTTLINDVLDFSKIEAGKMELESISFSPCMVIEEAVELLASKAHRKGLEIACDLGNDLQIAALGDPNRIRQILINLVNNAIKFTDSGEIVVSAQCESCSDMDAIIRFSVTDTGVGIAPDRRDRLFKSFSQIDASTTRKHGGTGLGLAISKQLAELMGGSIGVESEPGRGSMFWFTARVQTESIPREPATDSHALKSLCVLLADAHSKTRGIIKRRLEELGIEVTVAPDAESLHKVLDKAGADARPFNLVFIADQLSGKKSIELAAIVKSSSGHEDARMIMLVKSDQDMDVPTLRRVGVHGYLTKPITRANLKQVIMNAADPAAPSPLVDENLATPALDAAAFAPPVRNARILLAEDHEVNQLVVVDMLANAGYRCDVVADGMSAVDAIGAGDRYDLILMDCQMPRMDGFEATRLIRERETGVASGASKRRVPIIALTASAVRGDKQRCFDAGMDGYCTKPIDSGQLIEAIESHLDADAPVKAATDSAIATNSPPTTAVEAPAQSAPLDYNALVRRCNGKPELASRVLDALTARMADAAASMQRSLESQDASELARVAHGIKGAAGMASADTLHQAAAQLEELARAGELDGFRRQLEAFCDEVRRCDQFIRRGIPNSGSAGSTSTQARV